MADSRRIDQYRPRHHNFVAIVPQNQLRMCGTPTQDWRSANVMQDSSDGGTYSTRTNKSNCGIVRHLAFS
jgi:hypothetical protein